MLSFLPTRTHDDNNITCCNPISAICMMPSAHSWSLLFCPTHLQSNQCLCPNSKALQKKLDLDLAGVLLWLLLVIWFLPGQTAWPSNLPAMAHAAIKTNSACILWHNVRLRQWSLQSMLHSMLSLKISMTNGRIQQKDQWSNGTIHHKDRQNQTKKLNALNRKFKTLTKHVSHMFNMFEWAM